MSKRAHWWAPWGKCLHLSISDAMLWQKSWYEQQQLLVLFEYGAAKLDMKEAQAAYDVHKIEIEKLETILRKGHGTTKHWRSFDQQTEKIKEDLIDMQNCRCRIFKCRDHLIFLKWRIEEAEQDYKQPLNQEEQSQESAFDIMTLVEEDESEEFSEGGECVMMDLDDLN